MSMGPIDQILTHLKDNRRYNLLDHDTVCVAVGDRNLVLHAHGENQEKLVVLELRGGAMPVLADCHLSTPDSLSPLWEALGVPPAQARL